MPLSDASIRSLKPAEKPYREYDERGLYLEISPSGAKLWRFKYRFAGKEKRLSCGTYPDVPLKEARERRDQARKQLANGEDPGHLKQAAKRAKVDAFGNTFEVIAREWYQQNERDWAENHKTRLLSMFERCVFPFIGDRPVTDITAPQILEIARRIEKTSLETAHRAINDCGRVFRYAIATARAAVDPTPFLKGALPPKRGGHFAATIEPKRIGQILRMFDQYDGAPAVRCALRLSPLVFVRPGELRTAEWPHLNGAQWEYTIGKTDTPHIVPLSTQAQAIIEEMRPYTGKPPKDGKHYIFQNLRNGRPLSDNALLVAMRTMGIGQEEMTTHGWRAVARTLLDEVLKYPPHLIEHQLGHAVRDANGRAYNRTTHLDERREMMQRWASYLDELKGK